MTSVGKGRATLGYLLFVVFLCFVGYGAYLSMDAHTITSDGGNLSGFDNITVTGAITGDSTAAITGFTIGSASDSAVFGTATITQGIVTTDNITTANITTANITTGNITDLAVTDTTPTFVDNSIAGADIVDLSVTSGKLASGVQSAIPGDSSNLVVKSVADNQNVDIDADYVIVADSTPTFYLASSVDLTIDLSTSGANGLDNGSLATNTGYYLYVIYNGSTVAGLASTSATAPTMPSGYTYKGRVSWVTTDNTADPFNIEEFVQVSNVYTWTTKQKVVDNGGSTTTGALDLSPTGTGSYAIVPPSITEGIFGKVMANGALVFHINQVTFADSISYDNDIVDQVIYLAASTVVQPWRITALSESQTLYIQASASTIDLWVCGFTLR